MSIAGDLAVGSLEQAEERTSVLVVAPAPLGEAGHALIEALGGFPALGLHPGRLEEGPAAHDAVLAVSAPGPLPPEEEEALERFLREGGAAVVLGDAADRWGADGSAPGALGLPPPAAVAAETELRIRPVPGPLTARLEPAFFVRDRLRLDLAPPRDGVPLLTADWQGRRQVVAYSRRVGAGVLVHLGLNRLDGGGEANVARLIHRCLRLGTAPAPATIGIGLVGYGAIGAEHAQAIAGTDGLRLMGVADLAEERRRRAAAEAAVTTHTSIDALLQDSAVDLVVIGTSPDSHAGLSLHSLAAGRHVVCEKPLALRVADADRMMAAAETSRRLLTTYQNRRWDPDFVALERSIRSGAIGDPFHIEMFVGGYRHPCAYWHSHEPASGGTLFDWGSHYLDWILTLIPSPIASVRAHGHKRVWLDVTNQDQVQLDLAFADGRTASFLHSDIAAALKPKWYVLGTAGALVGDWRSETLRTRGRAGELVEERLAPADATAALRLIRPDGFGGAHEERIALPPGRPEGFYRNLAGHLLDGEPLAVPATASRRIVAVLEAAGASIAAGGLPVTLDL